MKKCGCDFICIAGKNNIAVDVLSYVVKRYDCDRIGVVCNKTETGKNNFQRSLRWFAKKYKIREYQLDEICKIENLIFFSLEFDQILIPEKFKDARLYNIHFSLLPKYKGVYTAAMPILNGEEETGVTLHRIDAGIDTGEIIAQRSFRISTMNCREVYLSCMKLGAKLMLENIDSIICNKENSNPQSVVGSTYFSRDSMDYSNTEIDVFQTAEVISRQVRAYHFREFQLPMFRGKRIIDYNFTDDRSRRKPGAILIDTEEACRISTIDYDIILQYDRAEELMEYCRRGNVEGVKSICTSRKHINLCDDNGWTPLMAATCNNQVEIVKYLILCGADIHAVNYNGTTLLMYAMEAGLRTGDWGLFRLYVQLGLDVHERNYEENGVVEVMKHMGTDDIPEDIRKIIWGEEMNWQKGEI